jgi:hypothetical protein
MTSEHMLREDSLNFKRNTLAMCQNFWTDPKMTQWARTRPPPHRRHLANASSQALRPDKPVKSPQP